MLFLLNVDDMNKRGHKMDFMTIFDDCISFAKEKIDTAMDFWNGLEENKKRLLVGCAIASVAVILIVSVAYNLGKAKGERLAFEEEDF